MAKKILPAVLLIGLALSGCRNLNCGLDPRPSKWAEPAKGDGTRGLNLFRVDTGLYRGAQPSPQQIEMLHGMGVKTIVNLREDPANESLATKLGMKYVSIPMDAFAVRQEQLTQFLTVMKDPANHPVFLHCKHGADRTGLMSAIYRVVVQDWDEQEAIDELTRGGYGFHPLLQNLVRIVRDCDRSQMRQLAGYEEPLEVADRLLPPVTAQN